MAAPSPVARPSLTDVVPLEFANATCEIAIQKLTSLCEELGDDVHVRKLPAKLQSLKLWQRAFTWAEYAQCGHAEHPELLDHFESYDEVSELVYEAAIGRQKLAKNQSITTNELAAIANVSRIRIGNLVRKKDPRTGRSQLEAENKARAAPGDGYTFSAAEARKFLRSRGVAGF